jgi:hypothetical protein
MAVVHAWTASRSNETLAAAAADELDLTPFAFAGRLLARDDLKKLMTTGQPSGDFNAGCQHLKIVPHPAILSALGLCGETGNVTIRNHICDAGSLCALLAVLRASPSVKSLKFWACSLPSEAIELLRCHLPASILTLAIEADQTPASLLMGLPSLKVASLRCCTLPDLEVAPLCSALGANATLTSLSLYSCALGDEAGSAILASLRPNSSLLALNLGANRLTDVSAAAVLAVMRDLGPAPTKATDGAVTAVEPVKAPNRTLAALNLAGNRIGVVGRAALEQAMDANPALKRLELRGNPCLTAGPGAWLTRAQRQIVQQTWAALDGVDGGKLGMMKKLAGVTLERIPGAAAAALMPLDKPLDTLHGLERLAQSALFQMEELVPRLSDPETLAFSLEYLGKRAASRGLPPIGSFDTFGSALLEALASSLGTAMTQDASAAWSCAYAAGSAKMQEAYTAGQVVECKASREAAETAGEAAVATAGAPGDKEESAANE